MTREAVQGLDVTTASRKSTSGIINRLKSILISNLFLEEAHLMSE